MLEKLSTTPSLGVGPLRGALPSVLSESLKAVANSPQAFQKIPAQSVSSAAGPGLLYAEAIQAVADRYGVVLGIRAPNPLSASLLREGFSSKNFHVKAKSSGTGPTAGFIPLNPAYSKVVPGQVARQQRSIEGALAGGAKAVNLMLSPARIDELLATGHMAARGSGYRAEYPSGASAHFSIDAKGQVFDEAGPVKVLSNPGSDRAITADYDLFSIYPRRAQGDNVRPLRVAPMFVGNACEELRQRARPLLTGRPAFEGAQEHVDMGNIHRFGIAIVQALNREIAGAGYTGGNLVWHNDETGNPFSPGFDARDAPIFFLPRDRGSGETPRPRQVSSREELLALQGQLRAAGFQVEYSPRFGF
ncbi:anthrax toxin-like adenylyl cyclase domain-containing protein [Pseudomonas gingeri]|uniref:anthrax toxin-like adenylyl cyclase domain-containing protein n=1 Tax=Pseudomonas gingeri TaxID=117681 RepID=UPI0015A35BD0|nr:anthrax toxin-like adenylyl cyclase domain-containing protein [Pseudomonas gingeri]NWE44857.1 toxin protein [Pseudomonas gingeri]